MNLTLLTGAIKGWWRPRENIRHNREVPWETSHAGRHLLAPSHWTSFSENTYLNPVLALAWLPRWVGRALNWQITQPSTDPLRSHIERQDPVATQHFMQICQEDRWTGSIDSRLTSSKLHSASMLILALYYRVRWRFILCSSVAETTRTNYKPLLFLVSACSDIFELLVFHLRNASVGVSFQYLETKLFIDYFRVWGRDLLFPSFIQENWKYLNAKEINFMLKYALKMLQALF